MPEKIKLKHVTAMDAVTAVNATLRRIDDRLVDHGERVAYLTCRLCQEGSLGLDLKTLFLLSVFHDIGAYKTDEIDRMLEFETHDIWNHSIYGYLFLKYLTPLKKHAMALLYHHSTWEEIQNADYPYGNYSALIHLADRIDVALTYALTVEQFEQLFVRSAPLFRPDYLALAKDCLTKGMFLPQLADGSFRDENLALCASFSPSAEESLEYLKMVVYSIDFRSEHTVTHTVNTVSLALDIARHFNLSEQEQEDIYLGALLHDVGKIAIPLSILEYPGRLTDEQMRIMRTHVNETEQLIRGIVPDNICQLALRHHEKLDGSGYPLGLTAADLTFAQRIVAVADIVSALSSRRSYKDPFPRDRTLAILQQMSHTQLDPVICKYVLTDYDHIIERTDSGRQWILDRYQKLTQEFTAITNRITPQTKQK